MRMDTVLVTGGNGFVGKRFLERAHSELGGLTILSPSSGELDLKSSEAVEGFFARNRIDIVVHLAAVHGGVGMSLNQPLRLLEDNLLIDYHILKTAIQNGVEKFITFGSSCSYGRDAPLPLQEISLWREKPENSYGISKLVMLEHLKAQEKMRWVYFIPSNIYGFGDHFGAQNMHIIPENILKFDDALKNKRTYIEAWGDGSQVRDFVYVEDIVSLLLESIQSDKYDNDVFNLSTGMGVTIKQVLTLIRKYMDATDVEILWNTALPMGTVKKVSDNTKFKSISPCFSFTKLEEGLMQTVKEYRRWQKKAYAG